MQMLYSRHLSQGHGYDFILVRSGLFQKACRERGCTHAGQGYRNKPSEPFQNRFKIRSVWKSEPEIGPFRKRTIPFRYEHERQACSGPLSGLAGFLRVQAIAFHLLSPSILEKLFFPAGVFFFIFRNELLNFNLSEPQNSSY